MMMTLSMIKDDRKIITLTCRVYAIVHPSVFNSLEKLIATPLGCKMRLENVYVYFFSLKQRARHTESRE